MSRVLASLSLLSDHCGMATTHAVPWLVLVALASRAVAADFFSCSRNVSEKCACYPESARFRLICPDDGGRIGVVISPRRAEVYCDKSTVSEDLEALRGVGVVVGGSLVVQGCPLPDGTPFADQLDLSNSSSVTQFSYLSYDGLKDGLKSVHFNGLSQVRRLIFGGNGLTALAPDTFNALPKLKTVILSNNLLSELPTEIFHQLPDLEELDLGKNHLKYLPGELFQNSPKLRVLGLWSNQLEYLNLSTFEDLTSLALIDLKDNRLSELPSTIFDSMSDLLAVDLRGNQFQTLPENIFSRNVNLSQINLSNNARDRFVLPPRLFSNLTELKEVSMINCSLTDIPPNIFRGSSNLQNINMRNNRISELPINLFKDGRVLKELNLSKNQIKFLVNYIFSECENLLILDLSYNKLANIPSEVFYGLARLETLRLNNNLILHVGSIQWSFALKTIDLSNNRLSLNEHGSCVSSPLKACSKLETIVLSNNNISAICDDWADLHYLKELYLTSNSIRSISWRKSTEGQYASTKIDLSDNLIASVDLSQINPPVSASMTWKLAGNPLRCDCTLYDFFPLLEKQGGPRSARGAEDLVFDVVDALCAEPSSFAGRKVAEVRPEEVTCPMTGCVPPCTCSFRPGDAALVVDCVGRNLTEPPQRLPTRADSNHTELLLAGNGLRSLPDFSLPGYQMVSKLNMSFNRVSRLPRVGALSIRVLQLDHNDLSVIDEEVLADLVNLTELALHSNPWKCECGLQPLVDFVQQRWSMIPNKDGVTCTDGQVLWSAPEALCTATGWASTALPAGLAALMMATVLLALYYKYAREVKSWLYARQWCLWCVTEDELDKHLAYDVFLSYSQRDEDFVVKELVPPLEDGPPPLALCIHHRDFRPGESIASNITRAVADSRRTLVVLSAHFVESVWGRHELRTAHRQALSEGRARVVVVLVGEIGPLDRLDPELRAYLNMNTYVRWGDPWFWPKLRYALPHAQRRSHPGPCQRGPSPNDVVTLELGDLAARGP